jgi:hypothetical protein
MSVEKKPKLRTIIHPQEALHGMSHAIPGYLLSHLRSREPLHEPLNRYVAVPKTEGNLPDTSNAFVLLIHYKVNIFEPLGKPEEI